MALNSRQRIEAETLKNGYQRILRMISERRESPVHALLAQITKESGREVKLVADYFFALEPKKQRRQDDPEFAAYPSQMLSTIYTQCTGLTEFQNWDFSYRQFQQERADFAMFSVMVVNPLALLPEAAVSMVGSSGSRIELTAADRRFLQSLRIAPDTNEETPS